MKIIDTEIANGKSSITRIIHAKLDNGSKVKLSVKSDNNEYKNTATLYTLNESNEWNVIYSISPSNMTTRAGLSEQWDKSKDEIEFRTQKDMDKLFEMAHELLD